MPTFQVFRMKEQARQQFRWAPHTIGLTNAKPKDYLAAESVTAESAYALWASLKGTDRALQVGDILEAEGGALSIYKYVGFEEVRWAVPEAAAGPAGSTSVAAETASDPTVHPHT